MPKFIFALLLLLLLFTTQQATAQQQAVQLSGFVTAGDSARSLAGVAVYTLNKSQGTQTTRTGFFSITVLPGDTVAFSALGYQKQVFIVAADNETHHYTLNIHLRENPKTLPTVDVIPWATEHDLKKAVLGVKLPDAPKVDTGFAPTVYKSILNIPPLGAAGNFGLFLQQQQQGQQKRYIVPSIIHISTH